MSETESVQASFNTPIERTKEILSRLSKQYDFDHINIAVSGGTDSVVAADVFARYGPQYGFEPDSIMHINTGAAIPQSRLVAKTVADLHDLEFIEQGYRNQRDSIAARILENGWPGDYGGSPATGGHGLEWANRKHKPMDEVYVNIDGQQLWISGARKLESKKRQGNVPDSGIEQDKPRRVWVSPISGWTSAEKREYIKDRGLPVSEAYLVLGFSGECVACAHDNAGLLTDIDLLCPELSHAIRSLTLWLYQRTQCSCRLCKTLGTNEDNQCENCGRIEIAPKRLSWGWDVDQDEEEPEDGQQQLDTSQSMVGCSEENCKTMDERPNWILGLPQEQIVSRQDVISYWDTGQIPNRFPV